LLSDVLHEGVMRALVRSYCDAGGKSSDQTGYVMLVCHSAPLEVWTRMESKWRAVLKDFGVKALHTTDLMARPRRGEYHNWADDRAESFLNSLMAALSHRELDITGTACALSIDGYRRVSTKRRLAPIEELCLGYCLWSVGDFYQEGDLSFVFDRGDRFSHLAGEIWRERKHGSVMSRAVEIEPASSESSPGVQSADLAAWHFRTHWLRAPSAFPGETAVNVVRAIHYHNSKRFEEDDLASFDFDRLMTST